MAGRDDPSLAATSTSSHAEPVVERLDRLEAKLDALLAAHGMGTSTRSPMVVAPPRDARLPPSAADDDDLGPSSEEQSYCARRDSSASLVLDAEDTVFHRTVESCGVLGLHKSEMDDGDGAQHTREARVRAEAEDVIARSPSGSFRGSSSRSSIDHSDERFFCWCLLVPQLVIYPHATFRMGWDLVSCSLIIFVALAHPYRIAFVSSWSLGWTVVEFLIDIFFLIDIAVNLRTVVVVEDKLITNGMGIFKAYARSYLALDLVASLPIDWFLDGGISFSPPLEDASGATSSQDVAQLLRILRLMKLLRLLRIARLFRYLRKWEEHVHVVNMNITRLMKLFLGLLLLSHWNACLLYFLSTFDTISVVDPLTNQTTIEVHPEVWVRRAGIDTLEPFMAWSFCFYQALIQLLGLTTGVIEPERPLELWGFLMSIMIGAALYAVFVACLTAVFTELGASAREYRSRIDMLHQYMRNLQMPRPLRRKLQSYFSLMFPDRQMFDESTILDKLSHPLQGEIALLKCHDVLSALDVLHDQNLARFIATSLERVVFIHGDYVIHRDDIGRGMYFIQSGAVEIYVKGFTEPMRTLGRRSFFGEMALLEPGGKATGDVITKGYCEGFFLSRVSFKEVIDNFPRFRAYIVNVAKLRRMDKESRTSLPTLPKAAAAGSGGGSGRRGSAVRRLSRTATSAMFTEPGQSSLGVPRKRLETLSPAKRRLLSRAVNPNKKSSVTECFTKLRKEAGARVSDAYRTSASGKPSPPVSPSLQPSPMGAHALDGDAEAPRSDGGANDEAKQQQQPFGARKQSRVAFQPVDADEPFAC